MTSPYPKTYTPTVYYDGQSGGTPIDADNLNKNETAIMNAFLRAMMFDLVPTATKVGAYTANAGDLVLANAVNGGFTVTFPAAYDGMLIAVKKTDTNLANLITIATTNNATIDGSTTATIRLTNECRIYRGTSTGNWVTLAGVTPITQLDTRYQNMFSIGTLARQRRTVAATASTATTAVSAVPVARVAATVQPGRTYRITARAHVNSTTAIQAILQFNITTDGTNPTTSSTLLATANSTVLPTTGLNVPVNYEDYIYTSTTGSAFTYTIQMSYYNSAAGTINMPATATFPINLQIEDVGASANITFGANL